MAKLINRLLGRDIRGRLGRDLTLYTVKGQTRVRRRVTPTDRKTATQLYQREVFQSCISRWHALTPAEKQAYLDIDPAIGYNAAYLNFMKECLGVAVPLHATTHEDGGADEIDVAGLSGLLADQQVSFRLRTGLDADKPAAGNTEGDVWWATNTDKLYIWEGADWTEIGAAAGAALTIAETEVFNGTSPTSWTDLDLSGTIGANAALVMLKIFNAANHYAAFRKNGDADEFYSTTLGANAGGCAMVRHIGGIHVVCLLVTDTSGKIEWITDAATAGTTVDIIGYIK